MLVFLDFDGVLHYDDVLERNGEPVLFRHDYQLFQWAPALVDALAAYPDLEIVISSSWVCAFGFDKTLAALPPALQQRVVGATYDGQANWSSLSRYQQIRAYLEHHPRQQWLAVDDDVMGWPKEQRHRLVECSPWHGLGLAETQEELRVALSRLAQPEEGAQECQEKPLSFDPATTIIFLDFDGVLHPYVGGNPFSCVKHLHALLRACPAVRVVITSSWRYVHALPALVARVSKDGEFDSRFLGVTPNLEDEGVYGRRDLEILRWCETNDYTGPWLALDDQPELFGGEHPNLYRVTGSSGLVAADVAAIIRRIKV